MVSNVFCFTKAICKNDFIILTVFCYLKNTKSIYWLLSLAFSKKLRELCSLWCAYVFLHCSIYKVQRHRRWLWVKNTACFYRGSKRDVKSLLTQSLGKKETVISFFHISETFSLYMKMTRKVSDVHINIYCLFMSILFYEIFTLLYAIPCVPK